MFGGNQLDPEYAPWAKNKLNATERKAVKEIKTKMKEMDILAERISKLEAQIKNLQEKCRHRNLTQETGAYNASYDICVDCGKEHI